MANTVLPTETAIKLEPPLAVSVVAPARAAGLVPLQPDQKTALDARVDAFIAELAATDAASPEFGKKVDALANLGAREISTAAGQSNRFLERPARAMDKDNGIGADLTEEPGCEPE